MQRIWGERGCVREGEAPAEPLLPEPQTRKDTKTATKRIFSVFAPSCLSGSSRCGSAGASPSPICGDVQFPVESTGCGAADQLELELPGLVLRDDAHALGKLVRQPLLPRCPRILRVFAREDQPCPSIQA